MAQLPEGDARQDFVNGLASGWANASPQEAANFVASLPPGKGQDSAALNVLSAWSGADPAAFTDIGPSGELFDVESGQVARRA